MRSQYYKGDVVHWRWSHCDPPRGASSCASPAGSFQNRWSRCWDPPGSQALGPGRKTTQSAPQWLQQHLQWNDGQISPAITLVRKYSTTQSARRIPKALWLRGKCCYVQNTKNITTNAKQWWLEHRPSFKWMRRQVQTFGLCCIFRYKCCQALTDYIINKSINKGLVTVRRGGPERLEPFIEVGLILWM